MMTLDELTDLYEILLRQLLPEGGYDRAPNTVISDDVRGHAKALAQAYLDAKRLLGVIESIPIELLEEYENEYGLPMKCTVKVTQTIEERLEIVNWIRRTKNVLNTAYLEQLLAIFHVNLVELVRYRPIKCTAPCTSAVNTDLLRYKVKLRLKTPVNADMNCIIKNYLPAYLRYDLEFI